MRLEILGGIASGKSTLVAALADAGIPTIEEEFLKNPFFERFYQDPAGYAFETEITYLLQHYSALKGRALNALRPIASDFSIALDLAYAMVTLLPEDRRTFTTVLDRVIQKLGVPELIVKLDCSAEVELTRIRRRNRMAEQAIELPYLQALNTATDTVLHEPRFRKVPVVRVDSEALDFRKGGHDFDAVKGRILGALNQR